jgi:hypothetical protein
MGNEIILKQYIQNRRTFSYIYICIASIIRRKYSFSFYEYKQNYNIILLIINKVNHYQLIMDTTRMTLDFLYAFRYYNIDLILSSDNNIN